MIRRYLPPLLLLSGLLRAQPAPAAEGPVIVFNNSTGSDTAASGSSTISPAISAVATCHTNGAASTTIQWVANGLAAASVPQDKSIAIWLATAAGRRWSEIVSYAVDTVVVEDSFNIAAGTPVDCAVGGKRSTIAGSVRLFSDTKGKAAAAQVGWRVAFESTGTNYTSAVALPVTDAGSSGCEVLGFGGRPIIEGTGNTTLWQPNNCDLHGLQLINTSGAKATAFGVDRTGCNGCRVYDNIIGSTSLATSFQRGISGGAAIPADGLIWGNEIRFNVEGIRTNGFVEKVFWNYIHDNTTGIRMESSEPFIWRNLIVNNTGDGILSAAGSPPIIVENTIDGNGGDGVDLGTTTPFMILLSNQITNNGLFGVTCTATTPGCDTTREDRGIVAYNNFFNNTSGARNNFLAGESETTVDPLYVNRAAFNYCILNQTQLGAPPGPPPSVYRSTLTQSILRVGACQPLGGGGLNIGL